MPFYTYNIHDLLEEGGVEKTSALLRSFKCSINPEIEHFLDDNAIDFASKNISVTYLVFNSANELVGYFTVTHKPSFITDSALKSNTLRKKIERFCGGIHEDGKFLCSAFLIAQFGKNMGNLAGERIKGDELMNCVFEILGDVQKKIGGGVVFLECENKKKLLDFYQNANNRFKEYGKRRVSGTEVEYIQLLRVF